MSAKRSHSSAEDSSRGERGNQRNVIAKRLGNTLLCQHSCRQQIHIDEPLTCGVVLHLVDAAKGGSDVDIEAVIDILRAIPASNVLDQTRPDNFMASIDSNRSKLEAESGRPWFYGRAMWAKQKRKARQAEGGALPLSDAQKQTFARMKAARVEFDALLARQLAIGQQNEPGSQRKFATPASY
jgi:hypothetical protein